VAGLSPGARLRRSAQAWLHATLFSYSQVLFSPHRWVGLLLLAATLVEPRRGALGLAAVLLSHLVVRLARFSPDLAERGLYGYNPLLCGLAVGAFVEPLSTALMVLPIVVVAVVFLQTALESALGYFFNLPVLSLPFVLVTFLLLSLLPFLQGAQPPAVVHAVAAQSWAWVPAWLGPYLEALGAVFFVPGVAGGALVALAILTYSRIALLLSVLGYGLAWLLLSKVFSFSAPGTPNTVAFNAMWTAMALGGVWFVPQRSSFVFAGVGVLLAALFTGACTLWLMPVRLPALILPFNLVMILLLYAMRQRTRDGAPKAVDFAAGAPEVNLHFFRTRVARFGSLALARLALPFSGRWHVTQGVDGPHTHQGLWRHGLDFEVLDARGQNHSGEGRELTDYHCWRLPVCAPADGTVVKVVSGVPDNPPGKRNPHQPWGNVVILQHGPALFSLVAHLAAGSAEVAEGQFVRRGARLGRCGNSGRSFVPHLHVQVQGSPRLGAPTREVEFYDVVTGEDPGVLHRYHLPRQDEALRNVEAREEVADLFRVRLGSRLTFRCTGPGDRPLSETVQAGIDLYNNLYLESPRGDRLYFENQDRHWLVYDYQGRRESVLYLLYAAAPRVPFEVPGAVTWDDVLSRRHFRPRWLAWPADLADPFLADRELPMTFRARAEGHSLVVEGSGRVGRRALETRAVFAPERGLTAVRLRLGGEERQAELVEVNDGA
jgi:urea transporter